MDGDADAFEQLYRRWHPRFLRHATRLLGNSDEALDVCQTAAIAIAQNIHRLEQAENFGSWCYTILRNRAVDHIRQKKKHRSIQAAMTAEAQPAPAKHPADTSAYEWQDLIRTLSATDREVLTTYYVDDMTINEIARCLAIPAGTVKSRLSAARQRLKAAYNASEGDQHE